MYETQKPCNINLLAPPPPSRTTLPNKRGLNVLFYERNESVRSPRRRRTEGSLNARSKQRTAAEAKAFTLAETLLTLVIIGIIAAVTIPGMNANVQRKELSSNVKKAYATLNQAVDKAQIDLGYMPQCYLPSTWPSSGEAKLSGCKVLTEAMVKALNVARICEGNAKAKGCIPDYRGRETVSNPNASQEDQDIITNSGGCWPYNKSEIDTKKTIYVLADGMIIIPYAQGWTPAVIAVDVNGKKGPNRWGYDIFEFSLIYDNEGVWFNGWGQCGMIEKGGSHARDILLNKK